MQPFDLDRLLWLVIGAAVAALISRVSKLIDNQAEERAENKKHREAEKEAKAAHDLVEDAALRYLLKDRMLQACEYWLGQGYCPSKSREVLQEMFSTYSKLGGNSFMHELLTKTLELPIKERVE